MFMEIIITYRELFGSDSWVLGMAEGDDTFQFQDILADSGTMPSLVPLSLSPSIRSLPS